MTQLDENQKEVLKCNDNALVIASAGAGKTTTIISKINYLIENNICLPEEILVISFTNASVNDLLKKIKYNVNIYTFHKLAISILKKEGITYSICNNDLLLFIIKEYILTCSISEQDIILKYLKINDNYQNFLKSKNKDSFINFIITFINLYKTNDLNKNNIMNTNLKKIEKKILIIIFNIYKIYIEEKQSLGKYDFDDLIVESTKIVKHTNLNYKYIIIDEFQDTSQIRLNLIKEIHKYTNAIINVVGDDWQSIYRFSGCDLNIFFNYTNIFPNVKTINLKNTYRNSFELIKIASRFIEKNPLQIKKDLYSDKYSSNPLIFVPYNNQKIILKRILDFFINKNIQDIMILSRNNFDIYNYIDNKNYNLIDNILYYKNISIKYYTIHKSKGLEENYVIILNCNNDYLGFPNKIENNKIINKILPSKELRYSEERRLFYVAITRAREKTYLLYDKNKPSIFIKEIKKIAKKELKHIDYFK